jgi:hypothetical protein
MGYGWGRDRGRGDKPIRSDSGLESQRRVSPAMGLYSSRESQVGVQIHRWGIDIGWPLSV